MPSMNVISIGTDIIECLRIAKMIDRHGEQFLERVYTPLEIEYCQSHKGAVERFAGRFAAKESILKVLGTGWRQGISWLDMEIQNQRTGRPVVALGGVARVQAERLRIGTIQISLSHCRTHAVAFAMALEGGVIPELSIPPAE